MCRYNDLNLIKYDDAIRLHFDDTGKMAWLTMKNYGLAFWECGWAKNWDSVEEITVGVPAGTLNPTECVMFSGKIKTLSAAEVGQLTPHPISISISAFLDAADIINLQVLILKSSQYSRGGKYWDWKELADFQDQRRALRTQEVLVMIVRILHSKLGFTLDKLFRVNIMEELEQMSMQEWFLWTNVRDWYNQVFYALSFFFAQPRASSWICQQIADTRKHHFTAYFPHPKFIIQEQRTQLKPENNGKTINEDSRYIEPIRWPTANPVSKKCLALESRPKFSWETYFKELDDERLANDEAFLAKPGHWVLKRSNFAKSNVYLHQQVERITCYGFRGDKRPPLEIANAGGFKPGVTRTDPGVAQYEDLGEELDRTLKEGTPEDYKNLVKKLNLLTLGVYTANPDFKAFISASTSLVIAKHFANDSAPAEKLFVPTFCYAVRCVEGFHLPTDAVRAPGDNTRWRKDKDAKNALVHHAEQEVAVPLAIKWKHVVGTRKIRITRAGQFFCGPVFLSDTLRKQSHARLPKIKKFDRHDMAVDYQQPDDGGFDELFELFSGKSQGVGPTICLSYPQPPFSCPTQLIREREIPYRSMLPPDKQ
jgi:hypothetical protein